MKITKFEIHPADDPRVNRRVCAFLSRRLASAVGFIIFACFLTAASSARAEQPAFITALPAISSVATSSQAQGPLSASTDLGQAAMSQIISELNQRQFQLSVAATQTSAQRSVFVPQTVTRSRAK
jgi:hypothetical protein